jgi:hypothetical protein
MGRDDDMRIAKVALAFAAAAACAPAAFACDGKADVEAAFVKQQKQPWRTEIVMKASDGADQVQRIDFQPPDRMYRKATARGESVETIGISKSAWGNQGEGAGWQDLDPAEASVVTLHVEEAFVPPRVTADFKCLGDVTFEGKAYRAYQTTPEKIASGDMIARTIYVDPDTGLPAFNVVGAPDGSGEPLVMSTFSYPTDIRIEKP